MAEVVLKNVSICFDPDTALDDVSMTVPDGPFVVLLGPTGAGKTTTLRTPRAEVAREVAEVAEVQQNSHKLDNKATALSGEEMQRASIGRAQVRNPLVYLMDEPLGSLDAKLRSDLRVAHPGDQTRLHLKFKSHDLITVSDAHTGLTHGDVIRIRPDKPFCFDTAGARLA